MNDRLLVVEGPNDRHVILAIVARHNFEPEFTIRDEGGYESLLKRLSLRLKPGSDLERLGIVVDADVDSFSRWQSIKGVLERAGCQGVPETPDRSGTVVDHELFPRVGVWIMPNNALPGILEDDVMFLVPTGDSLIGRARQAVDSIPVADRRDSEAHRPEALIPTCLAWQENPGTPLGQAITKRSLRDEGPHVDQFLAWLTRVFA